MRTRHRRPWPCCRTESPRQTKVVDAWRATILHLVANGLPVTGVPDTALRALRRRGGTDRAIAELAHTAHCPEAVDR